MARPGARHVGSGDGAQVFQAQFCGDEPTHARGPRAEVVLQPTQIRPPPDQWHSDQTAVLGQPLQDRTGRDRFDVTEVIVVTGERRGLVHASRTLQGNADQ